MSNKQKKQPKLGGKAHWRTSEGVVMKISDMSDGHLLNSINMIKRYGQARLEQLRNFYISCPAPTADMAELLWEQEFDFWMEEADYTDALPVPLSLKLDELVGEVCNRSLHKLLKNARD
jgi:hypothetical protein